MPWIVLRARKRENKLFNWWNTQKTIGGLIWARGKYNAYWGVRVWKPVRDILLQYKYFHVLLVSFKNERPKPLAFYKRKTWAAMLAWPGFLQRIRKHGLSQMHIIELFFPSKMLKPVCPALNPSTLPDFLSIANCKLLFPQSVGGRWQLTFYISDHPLLQGLNWQNILSPPAAQVPLFICTPATWLPGHGNTHGVIHESSSIYGLFWFGGGKNHLKRKETKQMTQKERKGKERKNNFIIEKTLKVSQLVAWYSISLNIILP